MRLKQVFRYAFAVAIVALAALARWWLYRTFGDLHASFITFYPAVLLVATVAGGGPGVLATILSTLASDYWFLPPYGLLSFDSPGSAISLAIFTGMGLSLSLLAERFRRRQWAEAFATAKAEEAAELARTNERLIRQADELSRQSEELARSNKDLEQFAYAASHDLQEPLRMVTGFVGLLRDRYRGKLDDKAYQYIGLAVDGAHRMSQLIMDLLAYSRVGANEIQPKPTPCEDALEDALANLQTAIAGQGAQITRDPLPAVVADATQVTQLLQNLISNAIKFRRDDVSPEIHIGARREGNDWVLSVRDNGIGIPPGQYDRIFRIFQRLNSTEKYPGTGIGLAICKKIVERHGGRIWVDSKVGEGTIFYFTLPGAGGGTA